MNYAATFKICLPASPGIYSVDIQNGAQMLTAREQGDQIAVWFLCDPDQGKIPRKFDVAMTGDVCPKPPEGAYVGTALFHDGNFVLHVFAEAPR